MDAQGTTRGRGFTGVMRRWNFAGNVSTHGTHEYRRHPGAIVHEFGGTIRPKGVLIEFKEQAMARRAAVQHLPEIERAIESRIDRLLNA